MGASTQMHYNEPYFNIVTLLTPTQSSPLLSCIFGRPIKDFIPILPGRYKPHPTWSDTLAAREEALRNRQMKAVERWLEHTRRLPPLAVGNHVCIQNQTGPHLTKWDKTGIIIEVRQFDQYVVRIDGSGRVTIRNWKYLRKYIPISQQRPRHTISDDLWLATTFPRLRRSPDPQPPRPLPVTSTQRPPEPKPSTSPPHANAEHQKPSRRRYTYTIRSLATCRPTHNTNYTKTYRKEATHSPTETDGPQQERTPWTMNPEEYSINFLLTLFRFVFSKWVFTIQIYPKLFSH